MKSHASVVKTQIRSSPALPVLHLPIFLSLALNNSRKELFSSLIPGFVNFLQKGNIFLCKRCVHDKTILEVVFLNLPSQFSVSSFSVWSYKIFILQAVIVKYTFVDEQKLFITSTVYLLARRRGFSETASCFSVRTETLNWQVVSNMHF